MKYIDTHAHITSEFFEGEDIKQMVEEAAKNDVLFIFIPGTTKQDSLHAITLSKQYANIFAGVGIHPSNVDKEDSSILEEINYSDIKFIGESGIDLYHNDNPSLEKQIASFEKHLVKARANNIPIQIHARDSLQEVFAIISKKEFAGMKFIMHSFTGNLAWANKFIDLGAYISFSGIVTFKNAREVQEVAKNIPLDRIISETDSPFLTPTPLRGKMPNSPKNVKHVVDFIASIRTENDEDVVKSIYSNAIKLFNI